MSRSIVTAIAFYENSLDYKSIEDIKLIGIGSDDYDDVNPISGLGII